MFEVSWALNAPNSGYTQICGSKAGATLEPLTIYGEEMGYLSDNAPNSENVNIFEAEIAHFIDCLRTGKRPASDLDQAVTMQRMLQGIYDSARLHKEVEI